MLCKILWKILLTPTLGADGSNPFGRTKIKTPSVFCGGRFIYKHIFKFRTDFASLGQILLRILNEKNINVIILKILNYTR